MLEFLCIAEALGGRNVFSLAPGTILSLPAQESHGCGSLPSPTAYPKEKKSLHQDFGKAQLTALVLSILGYFITGKQGFSC